MKQFVFGGHGRGVEPRHGRAGQVSDVRKRHEPARENGTAAFRVGQHLADAVPLLQQITQQGAAPLGTLTNPQPPKPVHQQAPRNGAHDGAAETRADHRVCARVPLAGEHKRQSRQIPVSGHIKPEPVSAATSFAARATGR